MPKLRLRLALGREAPLPRRGCLRAGSAFAVIFVVRDYRAQGVLARKFSIALTDLKRVEFYVVMR